MAIVISVSIYSQTNSNTIFTNGDKINVELTGQFDYHYVHELQKGQSLYALSKTFRVPLSSIYRLNNIEEGATMSIGQNIKVPIKDEYLYKGIDLKGLQYGHFIPVYYQTKPKDNLFRISRIYFNQPTADLISRNALKNNNLSLGQNILIGWLPIDNHTPPISKDEFEEVFEPLVTESRDQLPTINESINDNNNMPIESDVALDTTGMDSAHPEGFNLSLLGTLTYSSSMKETKKSEVAHWNKSMPDNGMVYVLHNKAIINSYIEMYNPILKRSVRAKVIGRIPYGAYTSDVCLVLSPRAAIQLGALDNRFKVEVKALFYDVN